MEREPNPTLGLGPDGGPVEGSNAVLDPEETSPWERISPRVVAPERWDEFKGYMTEIFTAFGMDLGTAGTTNTPERFLRALFDSTSGYEGDPKLLTAFPTECRGGPIAGSVR